MRLPHLFTVSAAALWVGVATSASTASYNLDWTFQYEADMLPNAAGAISYSDGSTGAMDLIGTEGTHGTSSIDGGVLAMTSETSYFYQTSLDPADSALNLDLATGYTVEARMALSGTTDPVNSTAAASLFMNDGSGNVTTWSIDLFSDVNGDRFAKFSGVTWGNFVTPITDGMHLYQAQVTPSGVTLYIDGELFIENQAFHQSRTNTVMRVGQFTSGVDVTGYDIDYIRIYDGGAVPEPGSLALVSASLGLLALRRRSVK